MKFSYILSRVVSAPKAPRNFWIFKNAFSHLEDLILKVVGFTKKIEKLVSKCQKNLGAFGAKRG